MPTRKAKRPKLVHLRMIIDADRESWTELPIKVCVRCGISLKKPRRGDVCYAQGEIASCMVEAALEKHGMQPRYTTHLVPDFKAWLKGNQWPDAPTWAGD